MAYGKNLPIVIDGTTALVPHDRVANEQGETPQAASAQPQALPPPSAANDFNQGHHGHRVEKVHAHKAVGALGHGREFGDGDR